MLTTYVLSSLNAICLTPNVATDLQKIKGLVN